MSISISLISIGPHQLPVNFVNLPMITRKSKKSKNTLKIGGQWAFSHRDGAELFEFLLSTKRVQVGKWENMILSFRTWIYRINEFNWKEGGEWTKGIGRLEERKGNGGKVPDADWIHLEQLALNVASTHTDTQTMRECECVMCYRGTSNHSNLLGY